jgi:glycerophosphoryl diester phosphodiesterase
MKDLLGLVTGTLLAVMVIPSAYGFDFFEPLDPPRPFQCMAHRGAMHQAPENTRAALRQTAENLVEWAEVDVRLTKDGHHVICHDGTVDRTTDGTGAVEDLTLEQLKKLDAGSWFAERFKGQRILTLEECLETAKGKLNLYLDCKAVNPKLLVREIQDAGMAQQVVVFDDLEVLAEVQKRSKGRIAIMPKWHPEFGTDDWVAKWRPDVVEINADEVTREICDAFHRQGVRVQAKVLGGEDRAEVWDAMVDAGVDWLQTDLPEEIIAHRMWKALPEKPVMISCHRGAKQYAPENTLAAFEKAIRLGVEYVEFDARTTSDGQYYILHDGDYDRTTNGTGPLKEHDGAYAAGLDAGSWFGTPYAGQKVLTLDETIAILGGRTGLYFDAKDIPPDVLVEKIAAAGLVGETVVYDGPDYLVKLKELNPAMQPLCPLGDAADIDALCDKVKPYAFDTRWKILSKELIDHCHAQGVKVFSDAMGNETVEEYLKAIEWGIDLIQTDHPIRVIRAVELWNARK